MRSFYRFLVLVVLMLTPFSGHAGQRAAWCDTGLQKGWHFYCDPDESEEVAEETATPATPPESQTAQERLAEWQNRIMEARALAVLEPTEENIENYMRIQSAAMVQSAKFADTWRRIVWQNPELDYEAEHPQSNLGKKAAQAELVAAREDTLAEISESHALIYVGGGYCAVCKTYGPVLRRYAEEHNFTVLAITTDGAPLAGWEVAGTDQGQLERLGIDASRIPLTLLYRRSNNKVTMLGVGFLADRELTRRIHTLIKTEIGDAF